MVPKRRRFTAVAALILVPLVLFTGVIRRPVGSAEGGPIEPRQWSAGTCSRAPARLRLASFNIHSGRGTDQRVDLGRIAAVAKGYDLVSLQEVRGGIACQPNQADAVGALLGVRSLFAPTEARWWSPSFGNGLLTTTRIQHWRSTPLPTGGGRAYRHRVQLVVPFGNGVLSVLMTHLSLPKSHRNGEFQAVADTFLKLPEPAVLMGDLNMHPDAPAMRQLLAVEDVEDPIGHCGAQLPTRWEYILLRGVRWRDAGAIDTGASDHALIWVEIESR